MTKYTVATYIQAFIAAALTFSAAATAAAGGPDLANLDIGQWLAVIGAALISGGAVFKTPGVTTPATPPAAPADNKVVTTIEEIAEAAAQVLGNVKPKA